MSDYYNATGAPAANSFGDSAVIRAEFAAIESDLCDKLPTLVGSGDYIVKVNATGSALEAISASATRTLLGLVIGTNVQAYDAGLQSISGLTTAADKMIYTTASDTYAVTDLTSFARTLLDDANATAARSTLGLTIGTHVQAYDAGLQSISGLTTAADRMIYTTAADSYAVTTLTSFARTLLDDSSSADARSTLGVVIGADVQAYSARLADIAALSVTDGNVIVGNGSTWVAESGATARASLGLTIGTHVQAYDAGLTSIAGLTTAADRMIYTTASDTYAVATLTSFARSLLDDSTASAARATLELTIGTHVQAYDAGLQSISGLTTGADKMIYTSASDTYAVTDLTSFARTLLDDANATAARSTLGLVIGANVQAHGDVLDDLNTLGAASAGDQFLVSTAAGVLAWESGSTARASLGVDAAGTDNSTDVTLDTASHDYLSITGQEITLGPISLADDVTGALDIDDIDASGTADETTFLRGDGQWAVPSGAGDVVGPASSTDNAVVRFDGTSGTQVQNSGVTIDDSGNLTANSIVGLVIGTDVQAHGDVLDDLNTLGAASGGDQFLVSTAAGVLAWESGSTARTSLGLGTLATASSINNGNWSGTDLAIANGGTGASTAENARSNLGLAIGTDVQAASARLTEIAALAVTDGNIIVGNGSAWVAESGSTARSSLGLGALATASSINNSNWSGTALSIGNGGTGATSESTARTALGLAIGSDVQAYHIALSQLSTLGSATAADQFLVSTAAGVLAWESGATARASLGVDAAGTDNSTDVTLVTSSHDYLSISGQQITLGPISLSDDVTGSLDIDDLDTTGTANASTFLRGDGAWATPGDVTGPGSSTDRGIATWNSTSGDTLHSNTAKINASGDLVIESTTDASSGLTGSIQTDGGVGIAKKLYVGGSITAAGGILLTGGLSGGLGSSVSVSNITLGTGSNGLINHSDATAYMSIGSRLRIYGGSHASKTALTELLGDFSLGQSSSAPSTASSAGWPGQIYYDSNYFYVCVAFETWKRVALSTW